MKHKQKNTRSFLMKPLSLLLWVILLQGCSQGENNEIEVNTPEIPPLPFYIMDVSPKEISQQDYENSFTSSFVLARGVVVSFWVTDLDIAKSNQSWEIIKDRITLSVDGKKISNATLLGGLDGELGLPLVRASWTPALESGIHTATFRIITDGGDELSYSWEMLIYE